MFNEKAFSPDWASAPGDTITDILRERNLSEIEFARQLGQSLEDVKSLLQGRATITLDVARRLERVIGASVEFWMTRDFQYREDVTKVNTAQKNWLSELPISDMIRFRWLKPIPHPSEELAACLQFFNVSSIRAWQANYAELQQIVVFKTSPSYDSRPASVAAWLRQGEIEAETIECKPWNARNFQDSLTFIRSLTRIKDPKIFIPKLQQCCAESGVAVAIVRSPTGCRASGATYFLSEDKALLLLSFRYLTDDHFWFTFFHEAGHLLLHRNSRLILEGMGTSSQAEEQEANEFAARTLIPTEYQSALLGLSVNSREVIKFAVGLGISPGIVVGQLQHLKKIGPNQLNTLKRRFEWED